MHLRRTVLAIALGSALAVGNAAAIAQKGETVRMAWIDALTGLTAAAGQSQLKSFQFMAEQFNKSTDPVKVAAAIEVLEVKGLGGDVQMRKTDRQLQQTFRIQSWEKAGPKPYDYSVENAGHNFCTIKTFEPYVASTPTSCQMKRPAGL